MTISVHSVVSYRVQDATMSITNVENADDAIRLLAQTTLRNMLGTKSLSEVLTEREHISSGMQVGGSVVAINKHVYPLLRSGFFLRFRFGDRKEILIDRKYFI